jgi:endogenous inhibitor of DNA gyrase (YacG/DUF329 family)
MIDLGRWFNEENRISRPLDVNDIGHPGVDLQTGGPAIQSGG